MFLLFFLLIFSFFLLPVPTKAAVFEINFENYEVGDWPGQFGWVLSDSNLSILPQISYIGENNKAGVITSASPTQFGKMTKNLGEFSTLSFRYQSWDNTGIKRKINILSQNDDLLFSVGCVYDYQSIITTISYPFQSISCYYSPLIFLEIENNKVRAKIEGGQWSDWIAMLQNKKPAKIQADYYRNESAGWGFIPLWVDDITYTSAEPSIKVLKPKDQEIVSPLNFVSVAEFELSSNVENLSIVQELYDPFTENLYFLPFELNFENQQRVYCPKGFCQMTYNVPAGKYIATSSIENAYLNPNYYYLIGMKMYDKEELIAQSTYNHFYTRSLQSEIPPGYFPIASTSAEWATSTGSILNCEDASILSWDGIFCRLFVPGQWSVTAWQRTLNDWNSRFPVNIIGFISKIWNETLKSFKNTSPELPDDLVVAVDNQEYILFSWAGIAELLGEDNIKIIRDLQLYILYLWLFIMFVRVVLVAARTIQH